MVFATRKEIEVREGESVPMPIAASHKNPFCPMISITARSASARLRAARAGSPGRASRSRPEARSVALADWRRRPREDEAAKYEGKLRSFVSASLTESERALMQTTQSKGQRSARRNSILDGVWKSAEGMEGWMDVRMYQKELQEVG